MNTIWLCLHFYQLPLELYQYDSTTALAITDKTPRATVTLCNRAAAERGIEAGMAITTAQALAPGLCIAPRDPQREQDALQDLALWAYQFTPSVSIQADNQLLLEIAGCRTLFGGLQPLLQQIDEDLQRLHHRTRCAVADNPAAAQLLAAANVAPAHCYQGNALDKKAIRQALLPVTVDQLAIPARHITALQNMGLHTLEQVMALPLHAVGKRLGKTVSDYLQSLLGKKRQLLPLFQPPAQFYRCLPLLEPLQQQQALLFPIKRLLHSFCHYLRARQLNCQHFEWRFISTQKTTTTLTVTLSQAQNHAACFLTLTRLKLEQFKSRDGIEEIQLFCNRFVAAHPDNLNLFAEHLSTTAIDAPDNTDHHLIDKLSNHLGSNAVQRLVQREKHLPEEACQLSLLPEENPAPPDTADVNLPPRPLWLLHRPTPIQKKEGHLYWQTPLQLLRGPEKIDSTGWRRNTAREYFVAINQQGALLWVFYEAARQRWYLHGLFA